MRFLKLTTLLIICSVLISCSHLYGDRGLIRDRDQAYLKAESIPPLRIPPGLSSSTITAHYPVSDKVYSPSEVRVDLTPPGLDPIGEVPKRS